jgi:hypothetical protein
MATFSNSVNNSGENDVNVDSTLLAGMPGKRTRTLIVNSKDGSTEVASDVQTYEVGKTVSNRFDFGKPIEGVIDVKIARW